MVKKILVVFVFFTLAGCSVTGEDVEEKVEIPIGRLDKKVVYFPKQKYPETATFIEEAIAESGKIKCNLDRNSEEERKEESLKKLPPKKGYNRAVWPLPICKEGGSDASAGYVTSRDHIEAEKWILNELEKFPDGTEVMFLVGKPTKLERNTDRLEGK